MLLNIEDKTMPESDHEIIAQFVHDKSICSNNPEEVNFSEIAEKVKVLCDYYRKIPESGDMLISGYLCLNGGSFHVYTMKELTSFSKTNECRNHFNASDSKAFLIEPIDYPNIEPYNRQSPYYIGLGYDKFEEPIKGEKLKTYVQKGIYEGNLFTSFDEFWFNNYWSTVTIGLAIKTEDISTFLTEIGICFNFEKVNIDPIINCYIK